MDVFSLIGSLGLGFIYYLLQLNRCHEHVKDWAIIYDTLDYEKCKGKCKNTNYGLLNFSYKFEKCFSIFKINFPHWFIDHGIVG